MRSVLARLVQDGYVTSEVNRGVRTRSFSVDEAADILEAREMLESALAGKAAERATEEEINELRRTAEAMEKFQAILLAIITRNPEAAIAAMRLHVSTARRMLRLD